MTIKNMPVVSMGTTTEMLINTDFIESAHARFERELTPDGEQPVEHSTVLMQSGKSYWFPGDLDEFFEWLVA